MQKLLLAGLKCQFFIIVESQHRHQFALWVPRFKRLWDSKWRVKYSDTCDVRIVFLFYFWLPTSRCRFDIIRFCMLKSLQVDTKSLYIKVKIVSKYGYLVFRSLSMSLSALSAYEKEIKKIYISCNYRCNDKVKYRKVGVFTCAFFVAKGLSLASAFNKLSAAPCCFG